MLRPGCAGLQELRRGRAGCCAKNPFRPAMDVRGHRLLTADQIAGRAWLCGGQSLRLEAAVLYVLL